MVSVPQTFSIALGAGLVAVVDYRLLLLVVAVVLVIASGYLLSRPEQRRRPAAPEAVPAKAEPPLTAASVEATEM
jgi:uncharacterized membrane protein YfcA